MNIHVLIDYDGLDGRWYECLSKCVVGSINQSVLKKSMHEPMNESLFLKELKIKFFFSLKEQYTHQKCRARLIN